MVESVAVAYQLFTQGELDHVNLEQANLQEIYADPTNAYNPYLVEKRPDKYSFQFHLVYAKNNEDGTPDVNWNTAVANENFRKSFYYGLDLTNYLARTNAINPLSCENFAYTMNGVAFAADGTDYADLVRAKLDIDYTKDGYKRYDPEKAAAYKAAAIEELTAKGVTFPVVMDIYVMGSDTVTAQSYTVLSDIISAGLGDDYLKLNIKTYVSSLANEVRKPRLASVYINGWGADFADPINFLGQETYNDTQAYYANNYSVCNDATDPDLIAAYEEFTALVEKAKVITDDMDARMAAFAEAEACMLDHALVIPCNYRVQWELTDINNYSKVYSMYGMQSLRYVDWQAFDELITTEQMATFAN
jgi:oligopeptide transport system substrate-binding protein